MFLDLINLYQKYQKGSITPLEDFNTEIFANLLVMYPEILESFLLYFFKLHGLDKLKVNTQQREHISGDRADCIVDLVISSEKYIIFIENKVESDEGDEQLDRYTQALHENHANKIKLLAYCTKYADPKEHNDKQVHFFQFRWYEVARFLETFNQVPVVQSYLEFLSYYKMNQDNTLKSEHLIAYENMRKAIEIAEFHIKNVEHEFHSMFGNDKLNKNANWDQLRNHKRLCLFKEKLFSTSNNAGSNVLYGIYLNELKLVTRIWISKNHDVLKVIKDLECSDQITKRAKDNGDYLFIMEQDLGMYLNKPEAEKDIKDWFLESFDQFEKLIGSINQS